MRDTTIATLAMVAVCAASAQAQVDHCTELLRLSRTSLWTVLGRSQFTRTVDNFCEARNRSVDLDLRVLGLGAGGGSASSINSTFIKYCSEESDERRDELNYKLYLDGIAPGAYAAYEACSRTGVQFRLLPPTQNALQLIVSFPTDDPYAEALMSWDAIGPVNCRWQDGVEERPQSRTLRANQTTRLACRRDSYNSVPTAEPDYVNVIRDGGNAVINIPWLKYNEQGVPIQTLEEIRQQISELRVVMAEFRAAPRVQSGSVGVSQYPELRDLVYRPELVNRDGSDRGVRGGRVDFDEPFSSVPEVAMALRFLDVGDTPTRITVNVTAVDREGFNYDFVTWSGTDINTAIAQWIAVAKE